ncbi:MAG: hypothetical protein Q4A41_02325 [Bacillota bacterium]|nr:hypothetical protein [Bacillota bacterium]
MFPLLLTTTLWVGLGGAVLMLLGDMILYFDRGDYDSSKGADAIVEIMKKVSRKRLYIGGLLGPVSAVLYCVGYYHIVLVANAEYSLLAWIAFFLCCTGIVCGGAFHSQCANLGLIGRHEELPQLEEIKNHLAFQKLFLMGFTALGNLLLIALILLGFTMLPRWAILFTPPVLLLLTPLVNRLPKGIHMVIGGGWTNMITVIYYAAVIVIL